MLLEASLAALGAPLAAFGVKYGRFCLSASLRAEWRSERALAFALGDLPAPCDRVGHSYLYDPNVCDWCSHRLSFRWMGRPVSVHNPLGRTFDVEAPSGKYYYTDGDNVVDSNPDLSHAVYRPVEIVHDAILLRPGADPRKPLGNRPRTTPSAEAKRSPLAAPVAGIPFDSSCPF